MRRPPPLASWNLYPVTAVTAILAILVTLAWWQGMDVSPLLCNFEISQGEIWRFVTSTLPHVDLLHLAFNLYWLWVFGTSVEGVFGSRRMLAILLLFAVASSAADYTLAHGGVGLSGVGYGLFGLLWVLSRKDQRFADAVDGQTVVLFVVWFLLCIAATMANIVQIGNVAHGAGAIIGLLLGATIVMRGELQKLAGWAAGAFVVLCLFGALVERPNINRVANIGAELAYLGYRDLERGLNQSSVSRYRQALEHDSNQAGWWYNLGVAYTKLGRDREALDAFQHAVDLDPRSAEFRKTLDQWKAYSERNSKQ